MRIHALCRKALSSFTITERLFRLRERFGSPFKSSKSLPRRSTRLNFDTFEERIVPDGRPLPLPTLFFGSGSGDTPAIRAVNAETGGTNFSAVPFGDNFHGGNSVASADFNNDGIPDLAVAAGPGGGPRVRIYDGNTGGAMTTSPIGDFWAYSTDFTHGVEVAAGDVNGDGYMDVITVPQAGGGPRIRAFSGFNGEVLADFFAYSPTFLGGLHIATGDFNIDNKADIVVAAAAGGGPRISIFKSDGTMLPNKLGDFFAFEAEDRSGVYVSVADVNGDSIPDIIAGSGEGHASTVRVFNGRDGSTMSDRQPFGDTDTAGVRVSAACVAP